MEIRVAGASADNVKRKRIKTDSEMNREIKFRGKCSHNGEWFFGSLLKIEDNYHIVDETVMYEDGHHIRQERDIPTWVELDTIGQFTGLYDKNGTPIYEGDIIKVVDCVKVVKYITECCSFCFGNVETLKEPVFAKWGDLYNYHQINGTYWEEYKNEIEVIGNIHDNPELLK